MIGVDHYGADLTPYRHTGAVSAPTALITCGGINASM